MKRMNNSRESFIHVKSKYKILNLKNRLSQIGLNDYWVFSFAIPEPFSILFSVSDPFQNHSRTVHEVSTTVEYSKIIKSVVNCII